MSSEVSDRFRDLREAKRTWEGVIAELRAATADAERRSTNWTTGKVDPLSDADNRMLVAIGRREAAAWDAVRKAEEALAEAEARASDRRADAHIERSHFERGGWLS